MTRLDNNQPLETIDRKELLTAVKELGWRLVGRCPTDDGCSLVCLWDASGRHVGMLRVIEEEPETSLVP